MSEPTPALDAFLAEYRENDNAWWHLQSGDHLNLFDEAIDELEALRAFERDIRRLYIAAVYDCDPLWQPALDANGVQDAIAKLTRARTGE